MNMIHTFTDKSKRQSKIIIYSFLIVIVLYGVSIVYGFTHISNFNESIKNIQILQDMNYNVHNLLSRSRMMSGLIGMGDMSVIGICLPTILMYLVQIEEIYIPLLAKYSLDPPSTYPIIIYNLDSTNGNVRTEYAHYNGYELVRRMMVYGRGIYDVPIEEWIERLQNGQNVLFDYRFR
ncbi:hypothetical protein BCR32DRAFT_251420 [Anaeromyces robustus]|uniref:DUF3533 domain-containing protein n=1 Tax=Anaeromyces robustus TaxID=1754192 RepID=A0A1Y1VRB0_9FUNG|nr:hypothetical protein BCR32DRAFT_251420 [Anaeromyces robustus]|eukprot:ORX63807.1 hypothetical protein BCR32DRAFT_251420 [Anaeromyces robustus]